jgi:hypothetical protein
LGTVPHSVHAALFSGGLPPAVPSKSDTASQLCAGSNLAYPELLNGFPKLKNLDFLACSCSTITDVLTGQLAGLSASTRTLGQATYAVR